MKMKTRKRICILLGLLLVLCMAGCGRSGVYAKDGFAEGNLGDAMHTVFFVYTVNSAYTCMDYCGYTPEEGNQLLVADVTVRNNTRASVTMYDTDFQVQWGGEGEDDYEVPITWYVDPVSDEQLPGEYDLAVNEERNGLLVFEVPEDKKDFSISYMELFSDETEGDTFFVYFTAEEKE